MHFNKGRTAAAFVISALSAALFGCSDTKNFSSEYENVFTETVTAAWTETEPAEEFSEYYENKEPETEPETESESPLPAENYSFSGRHIYKDDIHWLVQSGSTAGFSVTGTKACIAIAGDSSVYSDSDLRPRYAVYLDGEPVCDRVIESPEESIVLFEETYARTAEVRVMLLSEAKYGAVGIRSIDITGTDEEQITPLPQKDLAIEFIGDSITCGFGIDADEGSEPFSTATENFCKSYAYIAAQELQADYSTVAYSGYGVISGYSSGEKNSVDTVPAYYDIVSRYSGYDEKWDFSERKTDAVFINLGTNDTCYVSRDDEYTCEEFKEGYKELLKTVREKNPGAAIICTI
ncbi:MAG: GDSL-type esterase/lipase family protein, partial [Ruminococcus sp.]